MGKTILAKSMKVMVIVHGHSEYCICSNVKSNLRIKQEIICRKKGRSSIQITSLPDILKDKRFATLKDFKRNFPEVNYEKKRLKDFKLFIIMDVDDCTEKEKLAFINKQMFKNHWLFDYIVPIYNDPNLEKSMEQAEIEIIRKKDYVQIFPTNHGDLDIEKAQHFCELLKQCKHTNMEEYVSYCLEICMENKVR